MWWLWGVFVVGVSCDGRLGSVVWGPNVGGVTLVFLFVFLVGGGVVLRLYGRSVLAFCFCHDLVCVGSLCTSYLWVVCGVWSL